MTELEWHQQTSPIPSEAMRVTQRIRAFETQRVPAEGVRFENWKEFVRCYLRDQWCWHEIHDALFSAVASIEDPGHPRYLTHDSTASIGSARSTPRSCNTREPCTAPTPGSPGWFWNAPARPRGRTYPARSSGAAGVSLTGSGGPANKPTRGSANADKRVTRY
jgi:hypothetical protein